MSYSRPSLRFFALTLLVAFVLLILGCTTTLPQTTLSPKGANAGMILDLFSLIFWAAVAVFVVVEGLLVYTVIRFRARPGQGLPAQFHGNTKLEIAWTLAPALVLVLIGVPTWRTIFDLSASHSPDALLVRVIAHQWWWEFQYPDLNVVTANELHIPVGQTVNVSLESRDVIHSFWVPQLAGKTDVIPGRVNQMWLTAGEAGDYQGQCAEFCGVAHALMRLRVIAEPPDAFQAWVKAQQTPPASPAGEAAQGATVFAKGACITCHTIEGTPAKGEIGPNLTHYGTRTTLAGIADNNPDNLAKWLRNPQALKPGAKMPNLGLSDSDVAALVVYLLSLK